MGWPGIRSVLANVGVLGVIRDARATVQALEHFPGNARFWLHGAADGLPVPPLRLVRSATGTSSLAWSFHGGALAARGIADLLETNGADIRNVERVLDFGCGHGRVIRHFAPLGLALHGCDYNRSAVRWCRRKLRFATFEVNHLEPPLPYQSEFFGLVYALSVFTHLPEPLIVPWIRELSRIVKPGGFAVVSTHGGAYLNELTPEEQTRFRAGQAVVRNPDVPGTNRCGVYFSEAYVRNVFSNGFRVVAFAPYGATGNPNQDLVLLRKTDESNTGAQ